MGQILVSNSILLDIVFFGCDHSLDRMGSVSRTGVAVNPRPSKQQFRISKTHFPGRELP